MIICFYFCFCSVNLAKSEKINNKFNCKLPIAYFALTSLSLCSIKIPTHHEKENCTF